jgi:hypothetical protein
LPAEELIHRFLRHVLPRGLVKVRADGVHPHYGLLAVGQRKRLNALREQLHRSIEETPSATEDAAEEEQPPDVSRRTEMRCPFCGQVMRRGVVIHPTAHRPP